MGPIFRKRLPGALADVRHLNDDAARFLSVDAASPGLIHDVQLVLEEIATNVARHASPRGGIMLDVTLERDSEGVRVRVEDDGAPFDPSAEPEPSIAESMGRPWPGGYGLRIVRRTAVGLTYRRAGNRNILEMRVPERA